MTDNRQTSLEEVLDMLLDEFKTPSPRAIARYSELYPRYRTDLLCFAATWAEEAGFPEAATLDPGQEERVALRAQSFFQNVLHAREHASAEMPAASASVAAEATIGTATLSQLASAAGTSLHDVARTSGLPLPIMSRLNARGYRLESIPGGALSLFGNVLRATRGAVVGALAPSPGRSPAMAFLSTSKPVAQPPGDFRADIAAADIPDSIKAELLREE
jgi:hypothetical protein